MGDASDSQKLPSQKLWNQLLEPLRADNIDIPEPPLPESILLAFQRCRFALANIHCGELAEST
jgi:sacsin